MEDAIVTTGVTWLDYCFNGNSNRCAEYHKPPGRDRSGGYVNYLRRRAGNIHHCGFRNKGVRAGSVDGHGREYRRVHVYSTFYFNILAMVCEYRFDSLFCNIASRSITQITHHENSSGSFMVMFFCRRNCVKPCTGSPKDLIFMAPVGHTLTQPMHATHLSVSM